MTATLFRFCTDATLPAAVTLIRPAHLNELQAAIATPRSRRGRSPIAWTDRHTARMDDSATHAVHLTELRAAGRALK